MTAVVAVEGAAVALEEYRHKRHPDRTPEPMPDHISGSGAGNSFVVHEHHARALHWDLRLERDGVLVSWAVPKGLPTDPKVNRLAVHVEDHPLEYGGFEGTIGGDEYGAGRVSIWDSGTYTTEKWTDREVKFVLHGQRTEGRFVLFQTGGKNWMIHRMDAPAIAGWQAMPTRLEPMRAIAGDRPDEQAEWAFELRWDGVRALIRVEGGRAAITISARGPVTSSYPELRGLAEQLGSTQALIDGVITRLGHDGRFDREAGKRRQGASAAQIRALASTEPMVFLAFDLLHLDGQPQLDTPYRRRRSLLEGLGLNQAAWQTPPAFEGAGDAARQASRTNGLSAVIAKRLDSPYLPGEQTTSWIEIAN